MEIKEKLLSLIPRREEVKQIKVPDLKQYLVNGYEEIRQVKQENVRLENKLEEEKKNKQLYEGALVTLDEFKKRDDDNKLEIERLKQKIQNKEDEIDNINSELNTYKIKQHEYDKKLKSMDEEIKKSIEKFKKGLCNKIKNTKGNMSKEKIISITKDYWEE